MLTPTCSADTAELEIVFSENDDFSIRVRIDYICSGKDSQKVGGRFSAIGSHSCRQCNAGLTWDYVHAFILQVSLSILYTEIAAIVTIAVVIINLH